MTAEVLTVETIEAAAKKLRELSGTILCAVCLKTGVVSVPGAMIALLPPNNLFWLHPECVPLFGEWYASELRKGEKP